MRIRIPWRAILLATLVIAAAIKFLPFKGRYALADALDQPRGRLPEELARCIEECAPEDARFAERMLKLTASGADFDSLVHEWISLLDDMTEFYESRGDVPSLTASLEAALNLFPHLKSESEQAFARKVKETIERLPLDYPAEPRSHALLAHYLSLNGADREIVIENLRRCVLLDPSDASCRRDYEAQVKEFSRVRCLSADLRDVNFGMYLSPPAPGKSPEVDAHAIEYVMPERDEFGEKRLTISFTADGQRLITELTRQNVGKTLFVVANGEVLVSARISEEIPGSATLSLGTAGFDRICRRPTVPELPERLRL